MLRAPRPWPANLVGVAVRWSQPLVEAVRWAEVVAFPDASSPDDVVDILARVPVEQHAMALGCIAGLAHHAAASCVLGGSARLDIGMACLAACWHADRQWPEARARIARALGRAQDDDGSWQSPSAWILAVAYGRARDAADLLRELGLQERAQPLVAALLAFADATSGDLISLAPEVRVPAEQYLAAFHAAVRGLAIAPSAPTSKPRLQKAPPRRRRRPVSTR